MSRSYHCPTSLQLFTSEWEKYIKKKFCSITYHIVSVFQFLFIVIVLLYLFEGKEKNRFMERKVNERGKDCRCDSIEDWNKLVEGKKVRKKKSWSESESEKKKESACLSLCVCVSVFLYVESNFSLTAIFYTLQKF